MIMIAEITAMLYAWYTRRTYESSLFQEERIRNRRDAFIKQMSDKEKNAEARKKVRLCYLHTLRSLSAQHANSGPGRYGLTSKVLSSKLQHA